MKSRTNCLSEKLKKTKIARENLENLKTSVMQDSDDESRLENIKNSFRTGCRPKTSDSSKYTKTSCKIKELEDLRSQLEMLDKKDLIRESKRLINELSQIILSSHTINNDINNKKVAELETTIIRLEAKVKRHKTARVREKESSQQLIIANEKYKTKIAALKNTINSLKEHNNKLSKEIKRTSKIENEQSKKIEILKSMNIEKFKDRLPKSVSDMTENINKTKSQIIAETYDKQNKALMINNKKLETEISHKDEVIADLKEEINKLLITEEKCKVLEVL